MQSYIMHQQHCQYCEQHPLSVKSNTSKEIEDKEIQGKESQYNSKKTNKKSDFEFSTYQGMTKHAANDQSTQAMTEVALALSMAFFSLFILALISMGATDPPKQTNPPEDNAKQIPEFVLLQATKPASGALDTPDSPLDKQFIFYYEGVFYDQNLQLTSHAKFDTNKKLIVAMPIDTDVATALSLQQNFTKFDVALTLMDDKWLSAFKSSL